MKSRLNKCKLVVMDIGKTIFDKQCQIKINDHLIETLRKLQEKDIKVGVCTMRTYEWCKKMIDLTLDFYICLNGSYIVVDNKTILNRRIKNNFNNNLKLVYGKNECYYNNLESLNLAKKYGYVVSKLGNIKNPYVITLFNISYEQYLEYSKKFKCYYWQNNHVINIQNKNTSNLKGLNLVKEYFNLNECLYFGDSPNDLEIFQNNKFSILVKNGLPELKKYAYDVCDSCIENGVGKYLDNYYNLNNKHK